MKTIQQKVLVVILWRPQEDDTPLVLCLQRGQRENFSWQSVTGGVETGEDDATAALREVFEETGLKPKSLKPLGMSQEFEGRWGRASERAFVAEVTGGAHPPNIILDPKEHQSYAWEDATKAMDRVAFPFNREAICRAVFPPSPLHLSKDGIWSQDGEEITHQRTIEFLHSALVWLGKNKYKVSYGQEELAVTCEDCGRFISFLEDHTLRLLDGRHIELDPKTLAFGENHVLYALVEGERARFLRPAYYELMKQVKEKKSPDGTIEYFLPWAGQDYLLKPT